MNMIAAEIVPTYLQDPAAGRRRTYRDLLNGMVNHPETRSKKLAALRAVCRSSASTPVVSGASGKIAPRSKPVRFGRSTSVPGSTDTSRGRARGAKERKPLGERMVPASVPMPDITSLPDVGVAIRCAVLI